MQAVTHKSYNKDNNNERLEFIGDVVLGLVVSDFLFTSYDNKDEGQLSLLRSRLISRKCLNALGEAIGLREHILCSRSLKENKDITGNAIEAMFGAMYLNHGFEFSKERIIALMKKYLVLEDWLVEEKNPKSKLLEWAQKNNKKINFVFISESGGSKNQTVTVCLNIDENKIAQIEASSKKEAEFLLAKQFLSSL